MTTTKEAIQEILTKLDITEDTNWTEDGAPALDVVHKLADDDTITRDQINDALPGFIRTVGEKPGPADQKPTRKAAKQNIVDRKFTDDEMREILDRRVNDAEENVHKAKQAVADATAEVARCEARLARAHSDHSRQFPPITAAANIKAHLEAQKRLSRERAGLSPDEPASQRPMIDQTMERSRSRGTGQQRQTRPVMDGRIVTAA